VITIHRQPPQPDWDAYVASHSAATLYHGAAWPLALAGIFGLEAYFLTASDEARISGVLPLVRQRSRLFGDRLTSLPYVNYGGPLANDPGIRQRLMDRAIVLARDIGVGRVELRDLTPPPPGWSCRTDKVTLRLPLPATHEALQKGFGSKLRSQVRRAEREPCEVRVGGAERVDDFYPVFAEVMRDLGTPVYPRRFFVELLARLPDACTIVTLHRAGRAVAGAFLVGDAHTLEIPWATTVAAEKPKATNMLLYAEVLKLAVDRGCKVFDFGRSTVDSGPHRFKAQWGALPVPLYWAVWPETSTSVAQPGETSFMSRATRLWSRLPLPVANRLGPLISPSLPW
jgi:FemAB-related protein (PEP-CTERM system-associated)